MAESRVSSSSRTRGLSKTRSERSSHCSVRSIPLEFLLLPLTVLVLVPAFIWTAADRSIFDIPWMIWSVLVLGSAAVAVTLVVLDSLLRRLGGRESFTLFVRYSFYVIVLGGIVVPLAKVEGMQISGEATIFGSRAVLVALVAFVLVIASESRIGAHVRFGSWVFAGANAAFLVFVALQGPPIESTSDLNLSSSANIIVVSFDGLGRSAVQEAMSGSPQLADGLEGFTIFEKVMATSPATKASLAAELYGNDNFKEVAPTTKELWSLDPGRLLTSVLDAEGWRVTTYGTYGTATAGSVKRLSESRAWGATMRRLLDLSLARSTGLKGVTGAPGGMIEGFFGRLGAPSTENQQLYWEVTESVAPDWARDLTMTAADLNAIISSVDVGDDAPVALFLHFTHTHYPVEWDENCNFKGNDVRWYHENQGFDGRVKEAECALRQAAMFIERLDRLGVLQRSMVIIKSDHGPPVDYAPEGTVEAIEIAGHPLWGMSRYAPFLAIKPFGESADEVFYDDSAVILDDLARTVCEEALTSVSCEIYPGFNVLRDAVPPESAVTAFVVPSATSSHRYDDHRAVTFQRGADPFMSLLQALWADGSVTDPSLAEHLFGLERITLP